MKKIVIISALLIHYFSFIQSAELSTTQNPSESILVSDDPALPEEMLRLILYYSLESEGYINFTNVIKRAANLMLKFTNKKIAHIILDELYNLYKAAHEECPRLILAAELSSFPIIGEWIREYPDIQKEVNLESFETTPLISAACRGSLDAIESLLENGADMHKTTTAEGWNALMYTAYYNNVSSLTFLLNKKMNINDVDKQGRTALHIASEEGSHGAARYLLSRNALTDLNEKAQSGTPLLAAIAQCDAVMVDLLLQHGADPNVMLQSRLPALNVALKNFDPILVESLVEQLAEKKANAEKERSSLEQLVKQQAEKIVWSLIKNPLIDVTCKSTHGTTPLELAEKYQLHAIEAKIKSLLKVKKNTPPKTSKNPRRKQ